MLAREGVVTGPGGKRRRVRGAADFFRAGCRELEAAIPLSHLVRRPRRRGEVWGFQCFRSNMGTLGLVAGEYAPS